MADHTITSQELTKALDRPLILASSTVQRTKKRKMLSYNPAIRMFDVTHDGESYQTAHGETARERYNKI